MNVYTKKQAWRAILIVMMLCALVPASRADEPAQRASSWGVSVADPELKNFYRVDEHLYRSAQPDAAGMKQLEKLGIVNVLNLRQFHTDTKEAEGTSLHLYHVPMNAALIKDEDVIAALNIISAAKKPVLVHCWHGSDRTGAVVAMYRIFFQGWSKEDAITEMVEGGYGHHAIYSNIAKYIKAVDVEAMRRKLAPAEKGQKSDE